MNPIHEGPPIDGIGYSFDSFVNRFIEICSEHIKDRRARAFAFLLFNHRDQGIRTLLNDRGGFVRLDRLTGKNLSVFYIDSSERELLNQFNSIFIKAFDLQEETAKLPLLLFFKVSDNEVRDIEIVHLEHTKSIFAFDEIRDTLEGYIDSLVKAEGGKSKPSKESKVRSFAIKGSKRALESFMNVLVESGFKEAGSLFG